MVRYFNVMNKFMEKVNAIIEWFKDFPVHVLNGTIKFLGWFYDFFSEFILGIPTWLFTNDWFIHASMVFSVIGISLVTILSVYEGVKHSLFPPGSRPANSLTSFQTILKKSPIALIGSGFAPFVFEKTFQYIDKISSAIIHAGRDQMTMGLLQINPKTLDYFDAFLLLAFDIGMIVILYPLALRVFRRYFDLLALGALTPLALSCWIFNEHREYFDRWLESIKGIAFMQLYYAVFLTILGMLIMGIHGTDSLGELVIKLGIFLGGLWRMANPPSFVKTYTDRGDDMFDLYRDAKDTITMKNVIKSFTSPLHNNKERFSNHKSLLRKHREAKVKREKLRRKVSKLFRK